MAKRTWHVARQVQLFPPTRQEEAPTVTREKLELVEVLADLLLEALGNTEEEDGESSGDEGNVDEFENHT
jgi:hypothetical protein